MNFYVINNNIKKRLMPWALLISHESANCSLVHIQVGNLPAQRPFNTMKTRNQSWMWSALHKWKFQSPLNYSNSICFPNNTKTVQEVQTKCKWFDRYISIAIATQLVITESEYQRPSADSLLVFDFWRKKSGENLVTSASAYYGNTKKSIR